MENKPTKSKIKITAIIVGIVIFALIVPNFAYAFDLGKTIIRAVTYAILNFFGIFVHIAAWFLENMLNIAFSSQKPVVEIGWKVIRDFSNMFFILFMVVIAFATILRFERYGIKELLPKVIIIALLINFSLVICYVIIDFCDITAHYFINNAKQGPEGERSIATELINNLNLTRIMTPTDCDGTYNADVAKCDAITTEADQSTCLNKAEENNYTCVANLDRIKNSQSKEASFWNMIVSIIFGSIVLMVAAFVMFAGGILLVIRMIFLWFLVMIVPFVFLCYLMPALRGNWEKWWKTFLNWCFFGPVFAFFIWLTVKIAAENRLANITALTQNAAENQQLVSSFFSSGNFLISFIFLAGILIAGLIAAKQLGIYGANTALKIGQKWGKGVKDWSKARVRERAARPMAGLAGGMATALSKVPILRAIPGLKQLAKAPAETMKKQRAEIAKEKENLKGHSSDTLKSLYPTLNRTQQIATAQLLAARKDLSKGGNLREKDIRAVTKMANRYGDDQVSEILANRPSLAPEVGKSIAETIKKISPAKADSIQNSEFDDPAVMAEMLKNFKGGHMAKLADTNMVGLKKIEDSIRSLAPGNAAAQRAALQAINPKLTVYIDNTTGKALETITFG